MYLFKIIKVDGHFQHPDYQGSPFAGYDAALLYLKEKSNKQAIDIAKIDENIDNAFVGLGWHTDDGEDKLNWITLDFIDNDTCQYEWDLIETPIHIFDLEMICAKGEGKISPCQGKINNNKN